jgi:hypothetical protein
VVVAQFQTEFEMRLMTPTINQGRAKKGLSLAILLIGMNSQLFAGLPAIDIRGDGRSRIEDRLVGYQFTVHDEITITDLGKFDANANGTLDDTQPARHRHG